jgi:hypothetical protein
MKKGALPVPYIVAIIIAIIVIVAIVYWFIYLRGQSWIETQEQICRGKELSYCTEWATCGLDKATCRPKNPSTQQPQDFTQYASECKELAWASQVTDDECRRVLGQRAT